MKTKLSILLLVLTCISFAQSNRSDGNVGGNFTGAVPGQQFGGTEIFRFRSGLVTQLDSGSDFGFTTSRWFSLGRLNAGSQTFYGQRFQLPNRALVFGYSTNNATNVVSNPLIQWIGTGANLGNLEFRVANSFGALNAPGADLLVTTMTREGNTIFGNPSVTGNGAKVSIENNNDVGLFIQNNASLGLNMLTPTATQLVGSGFFIDTRSGTDQNIGGTFDTAGGLENTGILLKTSEGKFNIGIQSFALLSTVDAVGVQGITFGDSPFEAGIFGQSPQTTGSQFAGFFDGDVFIAGSFGPSDAKLKENIKPETNVLERLSQLNAVSYNFKRITELNLSKGLQHGFIAQDLANVFPELTKDIKKPVFDKEGKIISHFEFKSVNYEGLIPVLTAAVNELNEEIKSLKQEIEDLKELNSNLRLSNESSLQNNEKAILEQNIPNPFSDKTTIRYQYQKNAGNASLIVFDLNGKIVKEFPLSEPNGNITINASQIGKGLFIYGLFQNGQELITKKMLIN